MIPDAPASATRSNGSVDGPASNSAHSSSPGAARTILGTRTACHPARRGPDTPGSARAEGG